MEPSCRPSPEFGASRTRSDDEVVATHCVTCADEGIPMTVVTVDADSTLATCTDAAGFESTVEIALVAPVTAGDLLLVHAGTAIASLGDPA